MLEKFLQSLRENKNFEIYRRGGTARRNYDKQMDTHWESARDQKANHQYPYHR
jgi:hypothetical protein